MKPKNKTWKDDVWFSFTIKSTILHIVWCHSVRMMMIIMLMLYLLFNRNVLCGGVTNALRFLCIWVYIQIILAIGCVACDWYWSQLLYKIYNNHSIWWLSFTIFRKTFISFKCLVSSAKLDFSKYYCRTFKRYQLRREFQ